MTRIPTGEIPTDIPGWPDCFIGDDRLHFEIPLDEEAARWWVERFDVGGETLFPRDIAERLTRGLPGNVQCRFTSILPDQGRVSVELHGMDDAMNRIWFIGETLWFEPDKNLYSDLIEVDATQQRQGVGKTIMGNCFDLANALNMDELRLKASWVGTYAWLRYGFVPSRRDWDGGMKARVTEGLFEFRNQLPDAIFTRMRRRLESDNPQSAWLVADEGAMVTPAGSEDAITIGQALLANCGISWNGTLSLSDEVAVERFNTYLGRGR